MKNITISYVFLLVLMGCGELTKEAELAPLHDSFYDAISLGEFAVGFCDTVIYNDEARFYFLPKNGPNYVQYGYSGPIPLFLQIWHPIKPEDNRTFMQVKDFRKRTLSPQLQPVYDALTVKMDSFFIAYNLVPEIENYDSIDYGNYSYYDVLDTLNDYPTKSIYKRIKGKSDFPVIVYHHGSQGFSDENFILAEYFASRGYIVISSSFHLPFEDYVYGFEGYNFDDTSLPKTVINFAGSLTTHGQLIYIGHSAGAQAGFAFLHEKGWANAFVSLETTLEWNTIAKIKSEDGWPDLYSIIDRNKGNYNLPILMIANTGKKETFPLFNEFTKAPMIQISQKEPFGHESYLSGYLLRYLYRDIFPQPDTSIMKNQLFLYNHTLNMIEAFLISVDKNEKPDFSAFGQDFYINFLNYGLSEEN